MSKQPSNRHVRELDRLAEDLALLDREIAQDALEDSAVNRLMTITGVNLAVAAGIVAAIGDISRFNSLQKLVSYFGLNPRVRQSGLERPTTAVSARSAAVMHVPCWLRRPGQRPRRPVHCMRFSSASAPGAAIRSPRSPWLASPLCSVGIC